MYFKYLNYSISKKPGCLIALNCVPADTTKLQIFKIVFNQEYNSALFISSACDLKKRKGMLSTTTVAEY